MSEERVLELAEKLGIHPKQWTLRDSVNLVATWGLKRTLKILAYYDLQSKAFAILGHAQGDGRIEVEEIIIERWNNGFDGDSVTPILSESETPTEDCMAEIDEPSPEKIDEPSPEKQVSMDSEAIDSATNSGCTGSGCTTAFVSTTETGSTGTMASACTEPVVPKKMLQPEVYGIPVSAAASLELAVSKSSVIVEGPPTNVKIPARIQPEFRRPMPKVVKPKEGRVLPPPPKRVPAKCVPAKRERIPFPKPKGRTARQPSATPPVQLLSENLRNCLRLLKERTDSQS